jgi:hypothetical protein
MPTKKQRPKRKAAKPPPERPRRAGQRPGAGHTPIVCAPGPLQYKVVELSTVDEGSLERTLNEWTSKGWNLDGVQFAMRESSKRPSMAFLFFTRQAAMGEEEALEAGSVDLADESCVRPISPRERLSRLAGLDEE